MWRMTTQKRQKSNGKKIIKNPSKLVYSTKQKNKELLSAFIVVTLYDVNVTVTSWPEAAYSFKIVNIFIIIRNSYRQFLFEWLDLF